MTVHVCGGYMTVHYMTVHVCEEATGLYMCEWSLHDWRLPSVCGDYMTVHVCVKAT